MKQLFLLVFVFHCVIAVAQISESFSDGNFTADPKWSGNTSSFSVENSKLRSSNSTAGASFYLSTPSSLVKNTLWCFNADLLINPSGLNYADIFLCASDSNLLSAANNGYFIRLGGTRDEICFYKRSNGINSLLIDGLDGVLNKSSNLLKIRMSCDYHIQWNLEWSSVGSEFVSVGSVHDSSFTQTSWFGIAVTQSTSSFFQKHYFYDISVSPIIADTVPPALIKATFTDNRSIRLEFDGSLDSAAASDKTLFSLQDSNSVNILIDSLKWEDDTKKVLKLLLKEGLTKSESYHLSIKGLKDQTGNISALIEADIQFIRKTLAGYKDLIFTEFMIDPSPPADLPEKEFIEIYNHSGRTMDLKDLILADPSTSVKLPDFQLKNEEYLIICKITDTAEFSFYGKTLGLPLVPSLNNSDDIISLYNQEGTIIDRVSYKQSWYQNTSKMDGGYTLEIIDSENYCLGIANWKASESESGGTPGKVNSVKSALADSDKPFISDVYSISDKVITVIFNEVLDSTCFSISNCSVAGNGVQKLTWFADSLDRIRLELSGNLTENSEITFSIKKVKDCPGNEADLNGTIIIPSQPAKGDVIVNEFLFDPYPYGFDFVELYNRSNKIIDLKGWKLASIKEDTISGKVTMFSSSVFLKPDEYLVLTENPQNIFNTYPKSRSERIFKIKSLPTYPDDEGTVILLNEKGEVADVVPYSDEMHSPFLAKKEGISLERVSFELPSNAKASWTSASRECGFATPGFRNSQQINLGITEDLIDVFPKLITPNQDGMDDFMLIGLKSDKVGNLRNIKVFDMAGRVVKHLQSNMYGSSESFTQWDGSDNQNQLVPLGHYILWIELITKEGEVRHFKKDVAVGERF